MVDFRRCITALAVLALFAGLAAAQIGNPVTQVASGATFQCTGNAAATPQLRGEGFTELVGDILITCTGGSALAFTGTSSAPTTQIPATNITVYILGSTSITSRLLGVSGGPSNASEVLLLVDDPGSSLPTLVNGYGPAAPQVPCNSPNTGCTEWVGQSNGIDVAQTSTGTVGPNVFQGIWNNGLGNNAVTFYGVPVLPPATSGISRTYRITNLRVTTAGIPAQTGITAQISTNGSTSLPITTSSLLVGIVANPSLSVSIGNQSNNGGIPTFQQCVSVGQNGSGKPQGAFGARLTYKENGVGTAFKTRVVPLSSAAWSGQFTNVGSQNIPGGTYGGFLQNSESGFIFPSFTGSNGAIAGLADYGTRLKAVFTNIPTGVTIYIPTSNAGAPTTNVGNSTTAEAVLVSGESVSDGGSFGASTGSALVAASGNGPTNGNNNFTGLGSIPLTVVNGSGTAVWEVVNSNPNAVDTLNFDIYVAYSSNTGGSPATPSPTSPAPLTPGTVLMSYAPEPSQGAFDPVKQGPTATSDPLIPRFAAPTNSPLPFININICQTALLYPFVTAMPGFDTGIVVANTSQDPFNGLTKIAQTGSCTLNWYGPTQTATGPGPAPAKTLGCDQPGAGTLCWPVVQPGTVQVSSAQTLLPNSGFQGYMIAVCNFQFAHGYAAISDAGIQHFLSSYLAEPMIGGTSVQVCNNATCSTSTINLPNWLFRGGLPNAETFSH